MIKKIVCLGKSFDSEIERREYFRTELMRKLPELKKFEGYPIGEDEDIMELSDPPYYTTCPNPWLNDFIDAWEKEKGEKKQNFEVIEPFASDVSEGKNNPIYIAHSYHTKVPHPAIMRYILHYTHPGDIVFDGFAGTGMTGVAAQLCDNPDNITKLKIEAEWQLMFGELPLWGLRKCIIGDLSTIATLISYNYNYTEDSINLKERVLEIISIISEKFKWLYTTKHKNGKDGLINYVVWSDVFVCSNCSSEIIFWDVAVDRNSKCVFEEFECSNCKTIHTKRSLTDALQTVYDHTLKKTIQSKKRYPVLINYTYANKRFEKRADEADFNVLKQIDEYQLDNWIPLDYLIQGDEIDRLKNESITNIFQLFPKRSLIILSEFNKFCKDDNRLKILFTAILQNSSWLYRWRANGKGGTTSGTYYICSTPQENNVLTQINRKLKDFLEAYKVANYDNKKSVVIFTGSSTQMLLKNNSIDYIFTDPPFGANIMYSELNFLWESWLKVITSCENEAVESKSQNKSQLDYQELMTKCFKEYYRILKPRKWMTVEFSNTSAAVWNGIQTSLQKAGFVVANISALDKQQGSFKAVTTVTAVKQDLVISCYKPSNEFEMFFTSNNTRVSVSEFIKEHLTHLPIHIKKGNSTTALIERSPKILYDRLISYYLMKGLNIPMDSKEFQNELKTKFQERDGMYFTVEQVIEYEEKRSKAPKLVQLSLLVTSENEGIEWLRIELVKPQTYQELHSKWMQAITAVRKGDILPELKDILNENFIQASNGKWRVPDLSEAIDRDAIRNKSLLREFNAYIEEISKTKTMKLKEVRVEALRAGFKTCWEKKDFATIVNLGEKIPQNILLEDEQILMFYDIAKDRI